MRLKMRWDCTGDPPGELITTATLGSLERLKAFSRGPATDARASPGRNGVAMPMGPEKRSTGTTGLRLKKSMRVVLSGFGDGTHHNTKPSDWVALVPYGK